jgi:hypothetical protein
MTEQHGTVADAAEFEERWKHATDQPELIEIEGRKVEIDVSPAAMLRCLREIADVSRAEGDISPEDYSKIIERSDDIEAIPGRMTPRRFLDHLRALRRIL